MVVIQGLIFGIWDKNVKVIILDVGKSLVYVLICSFNKF